MSVAVLAILLACAAAVLASTALFLGSAILAGAGAVGLGFWLSGWLGGLRPISDCLRGQVRRATWTASGLWYVVDASGHSHEVMLQPASRILPAALWLRWRASVGSSERHFSAFLFTADVPPAVLRRFQARIRFESVAPAHASEPQLS